VCLSLFNDSLICTLVIALTAPSWHCEFPKVVQAHTSGEVGTLCTFLLKVYS